MLTFAKRCKIIQITIQHTINQTANTLGFLYIILPFLSYRPMVEWKGKDAKCREKGARKSFKCEIMEEESFRDAFNGHRSQLAQSEDGTSAKLNEVKSKEGGRKVSKTIKAPDTLNRPEWALMNGE